MWAALLIAGCEVSKLWLTGGGAATVSLVGEGIDDSFVVPGLSEEEMDELFADGHRPGEVLIDLNVKRYDPDFAASWHVRFGTDEQAWVEVVDNNVVDFAPCGTPIRHAELMFFLDRSFPGTLQFDGRGPDDPTIQISTTPPPTLVEMVVGSVGLQFEDVVVGLEGTNDVSVWVWCPSMSVEATMSVQWEFDRDIQRRAYWRGWKSTSGPIGPAQL